MMLILTMFMELMLFQMILDADLDSLYLEDAYADDFVPGDVCPDNVDLRHVC